jgi:hypothetical protein
MWHSSSHRIGEMRPSADTTRTRHSAQAHLPPHWLGIATSARTAALNTLVPGETSTVTPSGRKVILGTRG